MLKSTGFNAKPMGKRTNEVDAKTGGVNGGAGTGGLLGFICDSCKRSKLNFSSVKSPVCEYDHHDYSTPAAGQKTEHFKFIIKKDYIKVGSDSESEDRSRLSLLDDEQPQVKENYQAKYSIFSSPQHNQQQEPDQGQQQRIQIYQYKRHVGDSHTSNLCNDCWIYWKKYGIFKYSSVDSSKLTTALWLIFMLTGANLPSL